MRRLPAPLWAAAPALLLCGCFRLYDLVHDTADAPASRPTADGEAAANPKKDPNRRTYDNPDVKLTPDELADIRILCTAIVEQDDAGATLDQETRVYGKLKMSTEWGKLMRDHLEGEGRRKAAPRLARLLELEGLKWESADCRTVIDRWSQYN